MAIFISKNLPEYEPRGTDLVIKVPDPEASGLVLTELTKRQLVASEGQIFFTVIVVGPEQESYAPADEVFVLSDQVASFVNQGAAFILPVEKGKYMFIQIPETLVVGKKL